MTESHQNEKSPRDEALLIDELLGQCDPAERDSLARRLAEDPEFRRRRENAAHALSALRLMPAPEPPSDLTARTLGRIHSARRTEQLLDQQEIRRRRFRPTFRFREAAAVAVACLLLAAVFFPSIQKADQDARIASCAANMGNRIYPGLQRWENTHNGQLPGSPSPAIRRWWPAGNEPAVSNSAGLFSLVRDHYTPGDAFTCPARVRKADSFDVRAGMFDFPAEKFVSYSYQHSVGPDRLNLQNPRLRPVLDDLAIMADGNPVFADGQIHPERAGTCSDNHGGGGQNVLFANGQVRWTTTPAVGVNADDIYLAGTIHHYVGNEAPLGPTDSFLLPTWSQSPARP